LHYADIIVALRLASKFEVYVGIGVLSVTLTLR